MDFPPVMTPGLRKALDRERSKAYRKNNPDKAKATVRKCFSENKEVYRKRDKVLKSLPLVKNRTNARRNYRYANEPDFKLSLLLRNRVNQALKQFKSGGKQSITALGCSVEELITHLESQFLPGMTWDNWSRGGWHIDHRIPFAAVNMKDPVEVAKVCHYTNLQPLWAKDNLSKGGKHGL